MRDIKDVKFRGQVVSAVPAVFDEGEWVHGSLVVLEGVPFIVTVEVPLIHRYTNGIRHTIANDLIEVRPETVGQFTGLHDKNGEDLDWWEGDLISHESSRVIYEIFWDGSDGEWRVRRVNFISHRSASWPLWQYARKTYKVVGNKHENKDLIESPEEASHDN